MRLTIKSDGTPFNTRVLDEEGDEIKGVVRISWSIRTGELACAEILAEPVAAEFEVEGKVLRTSDAHQSIKLGRYRLHLHDYDGDIVSIVDEESKDGEFVYCRDSIIEAEIGRLFSRIR